MGSHVGVAQMFPSIEIGLSSWATIFVLLLPYPTGIQSELFLAYALSRIYCLFQGMLEPTKEPVKPISAAEKIASIGQTPTASVSASEMSTSTCDETQVMNDFRLHSQQGISLSLLLLVYWPIGWGREENIIVESYTFTLLVLAKGPASIVPLPSWIHSLGSGWLQQGKHLSSILSHLWGGDGDLLVWAAALLWWRRSNSTVG